MRSACFSSIIVTHMAGLHAAKRNELHSEIEHTMFVFICLRIRGRFENEIEW